MNPAAERLTGQTLAQAEHGPLRQVFVARDETTGEAIECPFERAVHEGTEGALPDRTVLVRRDGVQMPVEDCVTPIRDEQGAVAGAVMVFRDVAAKRREEHRRAFLARVTAELSSSLDLAVTLSTVAKLAVPAIADVCAVDLVEDGVVRSLATSHVDPDKAPLVEELVRRRTLLDPNAPHGVPAVLRTGEPELVTDVSQATIHAMTADEELRGLFAQAAFTSYIAVPLKHGSKVIGVIGLATVGSSLRYDASDLCMATALADRASVALENDRLVEDLHKARREADARRAEAELANRAKDEFLAMLGHELRNPLAPIVSALQLMKLRAGGAVERERTIVERQVTHMVRLVDDLLDISRVTRGSIQLVREPVEIAEVVAKAIEMTSPLLEQRRHDVVVSVVPGLRVEGDASRLAQVVSNLINNAAKYSHVGGRVWIEAHRDGEDEIVVRVRDSGIGIDADTLPRVFELFAQAPQALDRAQGGLGIGLAIVRRLVELHGGSVSARDQARRVHGLWSRGGSSAGARGGLRRAPGEAGVAEDHPERDRSPGAGDHGNPFNTAIANDSFLETQQSSETTLPPAALPRRGHAHRGPGDPGRAARVASDAPRVAQLLLRTPRAPLLHSAKPAENRGRHRMVAWVGLGPSNAERHRHTVGVPCDGRADHIDSPRRPDEVGEGSRRCLDGRIPVALARADGQPIAQRLTCERVAARDIDSVDDRRGAPFDGHVDGDAMGVGLLAHGHVGVGPRVAHLAVARQHALEFLDHDVPSKERPHRLRQGGAQLGRAPEGLPSNVRRIVHRDAPDPIRAALVDDQYEHLPLVLGLLGVGGHADVDESSVVIRGLHQERCHLAKQVAARGLSLGQAGLELGIRDLRVALETYRALLGFTRELDARNPRPRRRTTHDCERHQQAPAHAHDHPPPNSNASWHPVDGVLVAGEQRDIQHSSAANARSVRTSCVPVDRSGSPLELSCLRFERSGPPFELSCLTFEQSGGQFERSCRSVDRKRHSLELRRLSFEPTGHLLDPTGHSFEPKGGSFEPMGNVVERTDGPSFPSALPFECVARFASRGSEASTAGAEPVEQRGDAVEELLARLHLRAAHVAPGDGHAERGTHLGVGAGSGGVASDASTALVAAALADVEGDGAEGAADLLAQITSEKVFLGVCG